MRPQPRTPLRRIKQSRAIEQMQRDATDRTVEERHRHLQSSRALTQDRDPRYGGSSLDR
ncbi:hypothetical protein [Rothia dentocariosa]|uniref:hypothetical protein n=1 Tax=Rothia dentocariosa TaxID=2047 RepID=UPI0028EDB0E0|nr:hypothetical protein [Rothia dentocariosa]